MNEFLSKNDYEEPRCLLDMHPEITPIPVGRIIEKLDSYLNKNDCDAAERHLKYWLSEAEAGHDMRGKLTVLNEQIGLYRKTGKGPECLRAVSDALSLADSLDIEKSVTYGTTLINAATGYKAFGKAEELYHKAVEIMEKQKNGELEVAVTCLNLADLIAAESGLEDGAEEIEKQLMKAEELLDTESLPRDGYYAFVCEKCAPVFGWYGYFFTERELNRRAREIYDRA